MVPALPTGAQPRSRPGDAGRRGHRRQILDVPINTDDGYPDGWPDVKHQLQWTDDHIRLMAHADGVSQAVRGECAREAMEHALRAWISAVDLDYPITRNITQLGNIVIASQVEGPHPVARELRRFLAFIRNPNDVAGADILTQFAVYEDRYILNRILTRRQLDTLVADVHDDGHGHHRSRPRYHRNRRRRPGPDRESGRPVTCFAYPCGTAAVASEKLVGGRASHPSRWCLETGRRGGDVGVSPGHPAHHYGRRPGLRCEGFSQGVSDVEGYAPCGSEAALVHRRAHPPATMATESVSGPGSG